MGIKTKIPPQLAERLLTLFIRNDLIEEVLGDLEEKFYTTAKGKSVFLAKLNYWYQVFNYLRPFAIRKLRSKNSSRITMSRHYFKISWRILVRNKVFSTIKIGGFSIGIAACILISLFIQHELNYDRHYENEDRIFRITNQWSQNGQVNRWINLQGPLKEVFEENIPELEKVARVVTWSWGNTGDNHIRKVNSPQNFYEEGFFYADPELLEILEIPLLYGSKEYTLSEPNSMVISRRMAEKYFPNEDPVGRQMILNDNPDDTYTIGGVMKDFPSTSHLQGDFILTLFGRKFGPGSSGWCCSNYAFYTKVSPEANVSDVQGKMVSMRDTYAIDGFRQAGQTELDEMQEFHSYYIQPVYNIYLNPDQIGDYIDHGSAELIWMLGIIALIILLLACVNFVNLTTAKSLNRAKEVGLRKVVGANRYGLISQYLSESILYSFISILLGLIMAFIALPFFNELAGASLEIPWTSWSLFLLLIVGGVIIGGLSGIYPSLYLSRFRPASVLKGKLSAGKNNSYLRGCLVVFQFTVTIILLIGALVTHEQFQLVMNKSLGYEKDQVLLIQGLETMDSNKKDLLKEELLRLAEVKNVTVGDFIPVQGSAIQNRTFWISDRRQLDPGFEAARWAVDTDYIETLGMKIVKGRNFMDIPSDSAGVIINERMAREFGLEDPIGIRITDMFNNEYQVIGVVRDFYFNSIFADVNPLALFKGEGNATASIKIASTEINRAITDIAGVWEQIQPNQPFRYSFMNQRFESMYEGLNRAKVIFLLFATLSIIVACLGLFALSAFVVEQRSKEISIRKVLGASVAGIFRLLTLNYVRWVLISLIIAVPLGWYIMDDFLGEIKNRVNMSWTLFAIAGLIALGISVVTISFETIKAAVANPADKLRNE
ncbi:ABC transporter permease [Reichenbachiella sp. MALMAid0571]|uniref:ABC transporter permease n=1 Tax=Reichenbachiella sp. MALMAid0571 TaxID=3143939 RepID=UPI0032DF4839